MSSAKSVSIWLFFTAFMVFAMAIIGAITRLTESGLSMVEWRPLIGALPPLSETEWQRVYALYQDSPEFEKKHFWMSLEDFKIIFFWEWLHRFWGRLIGIVFILPLIWFWVKKHLSPEIKPYLVGLLLLGASQGLMGWFMVQSGLMERPSVSHFRLAAHLGLAFVIFAYLVWLGFKTLPDWRFQKPGDKSFYAAASLLVLTIVWGAFVAGLDAGLVYNTYPLMGDRFLPPETLTLQGFVNDPVWVQFTHRWIAVIAAAALLAYSFKRKEIWLAASVLVQVGLGIATLLSQVAIPLAALHQATAFIVVFMLVRSLFDYDGGSVLSREPGNSVQPHPR